MENLKEVSKKIKEAKLIAVKENKSFLNALKEVINK